MKRIISFIAGLALGVAMPVTAREAYLHCEPAARDTWGEACAHDNALLSYFNHGGRIPNRCKVS